MMYTMSAMGRSPTETLSRARLPIVGPVLVEMSHLRASHSNGGRASDFVALGRIVHLSLLSDGRMGASQARAERIRAALKWTEGARA